MNAFSIEIIYSFVFPDKIFPNYSMKRLSNLVIKQKPHTENFHSLEEYKLIQ